MEGYERQRATGDVPGTKPGEVDELLTLDEVAAILKLPKSWIYERTRRKLIPHVKLGKYLRFSRAALSKWIRGADESALAAGRARLDPSESVQPSERARGRPLRTRPP